MPIAQIAEPTQVLLSQSQLTSPGVHITPPVLELPPLESPVLESPVLESPVLVPAVVPVSVPVDVPGPVVVVVVLVDPPVVLVLVPPVVGSPVVGADVVGADVVGASVVALVSPCVELPPLLLSVTTPMGSSPHPASASVERSVRAGKRERSRTMFAC